MKIGHIGDNTANNAYLLAKFQRRAGIEADSYDLGGGYALASPYWNDALFDSRRVGMAFYDWLHLPQQGAGAPFRRPPWAKILGNDGAQPWYPTQEAYAADLAAVIRNVHGVSRYTADEQQRDSAAAVMRARQGWTRRVTHDEAIDYQRHIATTAHWRSVLDTARTGADGHPYDLVVLYGAFAQYGPLLPPDLPWLAFEHGTMRYAAQRRTAHHRALGLAYRLAHANVITNADCYEAAGMLDVRDRAAFIPHPLEEDVFCPGPLNATAQEERRRVLEGLGHADVLLFAPARHSSVEHHGTKRNDRLLHAVARYVREAEPAGAPKVALCLAAWGDHEDVEESERQIAHLGLAGRVQWLPCLPRRLLVPLYRMADVVLDQFSDTVGSFGTVTAEAMACGRALITYWNGDAHAWCRAVLRESPALWSARTTDDIYDGLVWLCGDPARRERLGQRARAWIETWHGAERVTKLHLALYERVLEGGK